MVLQMSINSHYLFFPADLKISSLIIEPPFVLSSVGVIFTLLDQDNPSVWWFVPIGSG